MASTNSRETPGSAPVEPPCPPEVLDDLGPSESTLAHLSTYVPDRQVPKPTCRSNVSVEIVNLRHPGARTVGEWRPNTLVRGISSLSVIVMAACCSSLVVSGGWLAVHGSPEYLLPSVAFALVVYILCRIAINIWRAHLTITTVEVVVAGAIRTHHVCLGEVDRFEPGVQDNATIFLLRHRGSPIGIWALNRQGFVWNFKKILRSLEPQASELNMILARARGGAV